ncbi:ribonuclease III, partial [Saccharothrix sp. MB29]|nr:ribonuclease III [Saccharothrix sp. MB29]
LGVPEYRVDDQGPDHRKEFTATVLVGGRPHGTGDGRTKKEAEQKAAEAAYRVLHERVRAEQEAGAAGNGHASHSANTQTSPTQED